MIQANDYLKNLTVHRQALHRIPELGRDLAQTKAYLASALARLDCRLTFLCDTGICAFFDRGRQETRAFRADMDALPIAEATGADYRSQHPGRMHACGHDGHMAMTLTLGEAIDRIKDLPYNVLLIFQPAEETLGGAEEICQSGILKKYNVTGVFGFHLWPFFEAGTIATKPGAFMPKSSEISLHIHGKSAHGTAPYEGCDALYIATALIRDVYHAHGKLPGAIAHFAEGTGDLPTPIPAAPEDRTLIHFGKPGV